MPLFPLLAPFPAGRLFFHCLLSHICANFKGIQPCFLVSAEWTCSLAIDYFSAFILSLYQSTICFTMDSQLLKVFTGTCILSFSVLTSMLISSFIQYFGSMLGT